MTCEVFNKTNSEVEIESSGECIENIQNQKSFLTSTIVGTSQIAGPSKPTVFWAAPPPRVISEDSLDDPSGDDIDCILCKNSSMHKCRICDQPVCNFHSQDPINDNEMWRIHKKNYTWCNKELFIQPRIQQTWGPQDEDGELIDSEEEEEFNPKNVEEEITSDDFNITFSSFSNSMQTMQENIS